METVKKGTQGDSVKTLQQDLIALGYDIKSDGIFGDATQQAVLHLQKSFGYTPDGIVGDGTRNLIAQQKGLHWNSNGAKPTDGAAAAGAAPGGAKAATDPNAKSGAAPAKQ